MQNALALNYILSTTTVKLINLRNVKGKLKKKQRKNKRGKIKINTSDTPDVKISKNDTINCLQLL